MARLGDGWMTTFKSPEDVQTSLAMIRGYSCEMGHEVKPDFEVAIYHNINCQQGKLAIKSTRSPLRRSTVS